MLINCILKTSINWLDILAIIISVFAILFSFYSWLTSFDPVIVFIWDNEKQYYYIKNIGTGPASNITVTYINDTESKDWKNPVKCYSLEPNGIINIDWGFKEKGVLFSKRDDTGNPSAYVNGVTKIAAVYSSSNSLCNLTYTSFFIDENTSRKRGNRITKWKSQELNRIWNLRRKSEDG